MCYLKRSEASLVVVLSSIHLATPEALQIIVSFLKNRAKTFIAITFEAAKSRSELRNGITFRAAIYCGVTAFTRTLLFNLNTLWFSKCASNQRRRLPFRLG